MTHNQRTNNYIICIFLINIINEELSLGKSFHIDIQRAVCRDIFLQ